MDNAPLHALANGVDGGNGLYKYTATSSFPTDTYNANNDPLEGAVAAAEGDGERRAGAARR